MKKLLTLCLALSLLSGCHSKGVDAEAGASKSHETSENN